MTMARTSWVSRSQNMLLAALLLLGTLAQVHGQDRSWQILSNTKHEAALSSAPLVNAVSEEAEIKLREMFSDWSSFYQMSYKPSQVGSAFTNFRTNMLNVARTNTDSSRPDWATCNQFCGMTFDDLKKSVLMTVGPPPADGDPHRLNSIPEDVPASDDDSGHAIHEPTNDDQSHTDRPGRIVGRRQLRQALPDGVPAVVDWREQGKVTSVRDQGYCGACWAFTAVAAIESAYLIAYPERLAKTLLLSEQQLIDCVSPAYGNWGSNGCQGGWTDEAMRYVSLRNITTNGRYTWSGRAGQCKQDFLATLRTGSVVKTAVKDDMRVLPSRNETALMMAVAQQPVVVYFSADAEFMYYSGGVFEGRSCGSYINHAMLVVGYNTTADTPYWIMKNSWGNQWGEKGFIRVKMSGNGLGTCAMNVYAYTPGMEFVKTLGNKRTGGIQPIPSPPPPAVAAPPSPPSPPTTPPTTPASPPPPSPPPHPPLPLPLPPPHLQAHQALMLPPSLVVAIPSSSSGPQLPQRPTNCSPNHPTTHPPITSSHPTKLHSRVRRWVLRCVGRRELLQLLSGLPWRSVGPASLLLRHRLVRLLRQPHVQCWHPVPYAVPLHPVKFNSVAGCRTCTDR